MHICKKNLHQRYQSRTRGESALDGPIVLPFLKKNQTHFKRRGYSDRINFAALQTRAGASRGHEDNIAQLR
jgi:hypothetical protein